MKTWFAPSRAGLRAQGTAWLGLSLEAPWEQTDSVTLDLVTGFPFLTLCGFEHLLPPSPVSLLWLSFSSSVVVFCYSSCCFQCPRLTFSYLGD